MPRISCTKTLLSYPLSAAIVTRYAPSSRSAISSAASRSAVPLHCRSSVSTANPWRFSIITLPQYAILASCPPLLRANRASGSVVDSCVSLLRFSPWKCRIARIVLRLLISAIFSLKALLAGPRLDQGPVYAEVLIRQQVGCPRLVQHLDKELLRDVDFQQPVAVFAVHRGNPDGLVHVQANEPAEQQVIAELFHQHPLATNCSHDVQK